MGSNVDLARMVYGRLATTVDGYVRLGHKGPNGAPTAKDAFEIASAELVWTEFRTSSGRIFRGEVHPPHPGAAEFNARPADGRRLIRAKLYGVIDDLLSVARTRRDSPTREQVPDSKPWCASYDIRTATRWDGKAQEFVSLECPGETCQYADREKHGERSCKVRTGLEVVLDEPGNEPLRVRVRTAGWRSGRVLAGVVASLTDAGLTVARGIPVELRAEPKKADKGGQKRSWTDITCIVRAFDAAPEAPAEPAGDQRDEALTAAPALDLDAYSERMAAMGWPREAWEAVVGTSPAREDAVGLFRRATAGERPPAPEGLGNGFDDIPY